MVRSFIWFLAGVLALAVIVCGGWAHLPEDADERIQRPRAADRFPEAAGNPYHSSMVSPSREDFHLKNPLEGYRRLTFMMLDADVVAVSPSSVCLQPVTAPVRLGA